ncbi:MAG: hypothetical protein C0614_02385 [Desulfuromonas sp.]|nr:MAG: hypothetical protein C0614_02385 [Desulfuromonas sp.]
MSSRSPALYLDDLLEAGQAIQDYVDKLSFEEFCSDRMRQSAVIREFEIIGEAVGKLPDDLKRDAPGVAWQDIKDFRNLLIHEYFGVDLAIVWHVIQNDLPDLLQQVELLRRKSW